MLGTIHKLLWLDFEETPPPSLTNLMHNSRSENRCKKWRQMKFFLFFYQFGRGGGFKGCKIYWYEILVSPHLLHWLSYLQIILCNYVDIWLNPPRVEGLVPLACQRSLWMTPWGNTKVRFSYPWEQNSVGTGHSPKIWYVEKSKQFFVKVDSWEVLTNFWVCVASGRRAGVVSPG